MVGVVRVRGVRGQRYNHKTCHVRMLLWLLDPCVSAVPSWRARSMYQSSRCRRESDELRRRSACVYAPWVWKDDPTIGRAAHYFSRVVVFGNLVPHTLAQYLAIVVWA